MSNVDLSALITAETKAETQRAAALTALANLRWKHEVAGLELTDGHRVATTRDSQSQIINAAAGVRAGLIVDPLPWKTLQGWAEFTPEAVLEMADQVSAHVRTCFAAERLVTDQIEAAANPGALDIPAAFGVVLTRIS